MVIRPVPGARPRVKQGSANVEINVMFGCRSATVRPLPMEDQQAYQDRATLTVHALKQYIVWPQSVLSCIYRCMHTHVHTYIHTYTDIYVYTYMCSCVCIYIYIHKYLHVCIYIYIYL